MKESDRSFGLVDTMTAIAHKHYLSREGSLQGAIARWQHKGLIYGAEQEDSNAKLISVSLRLRYFEQAEWRVVCLCVL